MPRPVLLVPGTQATTLVDQKGRTVYNAVRSSLGLDRDSLGGRLPRHWSALLSLGHDPEATDDWGPTLTSLEPGTTLSPDRVVRTPYQRLHSQLKVQDWGYDWRADLRWNALQLLDWLANNPPPQARGEGNSESHGKDRRWSLVGHSQGGLLIVLAARLAAQMAAQTPDAPQPDAFTAHVSHVVLVGTPLAGTLRALEAILVGRPDLGTRQIDQTRAMARSWPSLYQMLPAWATACDGGAPFTRPEAYSDPWHAGLELPLLQSARETHELLKNPTSAFAPEVRVTAIFSEDQPTPESLARTAAGSYACRTPRRDRNAPVPCRELHFIEAAGDGLVPLDATLTWCGPELAQRSIVIGGPTRAHATLCDDEDVVELVRRELERPELDL